MSLPITLQARADKCFKDDVIQSLQWCSKVVHCEKQQQQSERLSKKLLGLGQLVIQQRNLSKCGRGNFNDSGGLCPRVAIPNKQR